MVCTQDEIFQRFSNFSRNKKVSNVFSPGEIFYLKTRIFLKIRFESYEAAYTYLGKKTYLKARK